MKAKKLLFHCALLIAFLLLGCSSDDASSGSDSNLASLVPKPPTGDKTQVLHAGATISDIVVYGNNIKWYALHYSLDENTDSSNESFSLNPATADSSILLSAQTPLKDKTTYFATQTINNKESGYLPVSVKLVRYTD